MVRHWMLLVISNHINLLPQLSNRDIVFADNKDNRVNKYFLLN